MITDSGQYYLYRHLRLDTNQPFYIGIGTKKETYKNHRQEYSRAFDMHPKRRGNFWSNVYNKVDCTVNILLESNDYDFIKQKEIEFIKLYGRRNIETGILTNLTDGGEGTKGKINSIETRKRMSISKKGIEASPEQAKRLHELNNLTSIPILMYNKNGNLIKEFKSKREAERLTGVAYSSIKTSINKGYSVTKKNLIFKEKVDSIIPLKVTIISRNNKWKREIIVVDILTDKILTIGSIREVSDITGINCSLISKHLSKKKEYIHKRTNLKLKTK